MTTDPDEENLGYHGPKARDRLAQQTPVGSDGGLIELDATERTAFELDIAVNEMANGRPINGGDLEKIEDLIEGFRQATARIREVEGMLNEAIRARSLKDAAARHFEARAQALEAENRKMREALKLLADNEDHGPYCWDPIANAWRTARDIARSALSDPKAP
jgi:hypothetical protein